MTIIPLFGSKSVILGGVQRVRSMVLEQAFRAGIHSAANPLKTHGVFPSQYKPVSVSLFHEPVPSDTCAGVRFVGLSSSKFVPYLSSNKPQIHQFRINFLYKFRTSRAAAQLAPFRWLVYLPRESGRGFLTHQKLLIFRPLPNLAWNLVLALIQKCPKS